MIDLIKLKNWQKTLVLFAFGVSFLLPTFSLAIHLTNAYKIDLAYLIGFNNQISNLITMIVTLAIITWILFELTVHLLSWYFESERLFMYNQKSEVKFVLRLCLIVRNVLMGVLYFVAFFLPSLFNWFVVFGMLNTLAAFVLFFFIMRDNFGGDFIALHLFKTISKVYFVYMGVALIFNVGGYLTL